jgi:GTPase SAR1 family protein
MASEFVDEGSINMIRLKTVFVGDVSVGKTSVMNRLNNAEFKEIHDV